MVPSPLAYLVADGAGRAAERLALAVAPSQGPLEGVRDGNQVPKQQGALLHEAHLHE